MCAFFFPIRGMLFCGNHIGCAHLSWPEARLLTELPIAGVCTDVSFCGVAGTVRQSDVNREMHMQGAISLRWATAFLLGLVRNCTAKSSFVN